MAERDLPQIAIRVGIHSGPLMAGVIGGERRWQYSIIGDTANTAARLESYGKDDPRLGSDADHCRILISEATFHLLDGRFAADPVGSLEMRNRGPIEVYRITGRRKGLGAGVEDDDHGTHRTITSGAGLRRLGALAIAGQLGLASALALAQSGGHEPQPTQSGTGTGLSTLVYVPHDFDAPEVTQSGGVRSASQGAGCRTSWSWRRQACPHVLEPAYPLLVPVRPHERPGQADGARSGCDHRRASARDRARPDIVRRRAWPAPSPSTA